MANIGSDDETTGDDSSIQIINIAPHKIKYTNTKFKKVKSIIYDHQCDIKLRVENSNFKAHKEVLSDASDYFSAMFSHDMLEKEQDVIEIMGVSPMGFTIILDYFYHGHVTIETDSIEDVLEVARFFQVDWLVDVCSHYLVRLGVDNYQTVLHLSDKYFIGDLSGDIFQFLGLNISELSEGKDFFANLDLELLTQFLRGHNNVFIEADEEFILNLILKWVSAESERRQDYFLPLLRLIRFPLMELDALERIPPSVLRYPEIQDVVEEAKYYHNNLAKQSLFKGERFLQRGSQPNVLMFDLNFDYSTIIYHNINTGGRCHEELAFTGTEMQFESSSITNHGNFLYRSGGYNQDMCSSDTVFRFDPRYRDWTQLASLRQARSCHCMCSSEKHLFVVGGINHFIGERGDEDNILSSVEVCDVSENKWQELPPFPTGIHSHACSFYDDCLFVSGGISDDPLDSVPTQGLCRLNLHEDKWEYKADMLYQRQSHSMRVFNDHLYIFGGYTATFTDLHACEMYNIKTNQWTEISSIPESFGRIQKHIGLWGSRFFLFGSGQLHTYHAEEDRMECGDYVGMSIQKIACLVVAYPT